MPCTGADPGAARPAAGSAAAHSASPSSAPRSCPAPAWPSAGSWVGLQCIKPASPCGKLEMSAAQQAQRTENRSGLPRRHRAGTHVASAWAPPRSQMRNEQREQSRRHAGALTGSSTRVPGASPSQAGQAATPMRAGCTGMSKGGQESGTGAGSVGQAAACVKARPRRQQQLRRWQLTECRHVGCVHSVQGIPPLAWLPSRGASSNGGWLSAGAAYGPAECLGQVDRTHLSLPQAETSLQLVTAGIDHGPPFSAGLHPRPPCYSQQNGHSGYVLPSAAEQPGQLSQPWNAARQQAHLLPHPA